MTRPLALVLALLILAPSALLAIPPSARAVVVDVKSDTSATSLSQLLKQTGILSQDTISAIKNAASYVLDISNTAANYAKYIKSYILDPLAFIMSGNLLKSITSSILGFIGGKNGTGKPLYIQNLRGYLRNVGDVEAYTFLDQFRRNSNSPFAGAITSSLRADYLQQTTLTGFFAANRSTLSRVSSDPLRYVAGDWSKGGLLAWFGLTTQDQNNPYTFKYRAQAQLARQAQFAEATKLAQANWGQGFLSYCGAKGGLASGSYDSSVCTEDSEGNLQCGGGSDTGGTCTDIDADGNCISTSGSPTGEEISLDCPEGAEPAGTVCGNGSVYSLPSGYSCPSGSSFDNVYGGCEYQADGTWTAVLDSNGSPVYQTESSPNLDAAPIDPGNRLTAGASNNSSVLSALQNGKYYHYDPSGVGLYGGNCGVAVRQAHCDVEGGAWCNGMGTGGAANFASVGTAAGWTVTQTLTGVGTNAALLPYLQDGDIVQTMPIGTHTYGHLCEMNGGVCYSDTNQGNIVPYADARSSPSLSVKIWRAPARTSLGTQRALTASVYLAQAEALGDFTPESDITSPSTVPNDALGSLPSSNTSVSNAAPSASAGGTSASTYKSPVRPGDPCTRPDGTEGVIQTPGSIIKAMLVKALGASTFDKLVQVGDIAADIGKIMNNIGTVMSTVNLATSLFGGSGNGLEGFSGTGSYTSPFASYLASPGYLGLTSSDVFSDSGANTRQLGRPSGAPPPRRRPP